MMAMVPAGLLVSGGGDPTAGSGSLAVLVAVCSGLAMAVVLSVRSGDLGVREIAGVAARGFWGMYPVMALMTLAFALGDVSRELNTGLIVAGLVSDAVNPLMIPALLFLVSCLMSFSTGTSWGTFAIMVPMAVPMAGMAGLSLPMMLASVLGGGLFGDHCSPISDTTIISSMAAGCDLVDHVRTQLPYALLAAAVTICAYIVL
jgi:Na+/H+ antiporter NhaC